MLENIAKIVFAASIIAFVYWAVTQKEFEDYTIKCIDDKKFVIGHSGGIAGPIGECDE